MLKGIAGPNPYTLTGSTTAARSVISLNPMKITSLVSHFFQTVAKAIFGTPKSVYFLERTISIKKGFIETNRLFTKQRLAKIKAWEEAQAAKLNPREYNKL